jgi:hypothetical protein
MTPKEKALYLIEIFWAEVEDNEYETRKMSFNQAKQCALIAVDEILKEKNRLNLYDGGAYELKYWPEVKTEIIKL